MMLGGIEREGTQACRFDAKEVASGDAFAGEGVLGWWYP